MKIPGWFDYINEGGFPIFEARGKFPAVALAFVFGIEGKKKVKFGQGWIWKVLKYLFIKVYQFIK